MTKKKKIVIGLILFLVLIGLVIWKFQGNKNPLDRYLITEVKKENLIKTVSATGDLKSKSEVVLNFENSGRVGEIKVSVGDEIGEGEILANLSSEILTKQLEKAEIALNKAVAENSSNDDVIKELEQAVENAENYLEEVDDLEDQKILTAEQVLEDAEDYYNEAVEYYDLNVDTYGENSINTQYAKLTLQTAEANKHSAERSLETAIKSKDLAKVSAENSLNSAKKKLKTAESQFAMTSRNAVVESARTDYEIALANLEKTSLKSPVNGVITEINYKKGEVLGSSSMGTTNFGKIISKDFILEALISESDISEIKLGQIAQLSFDSLSFDEKIEAKIIEIEPASTIIQDVVYYKSKLKLDELDLRLKEGMSADVEILIEKKDNVLAISQSALNYENSDIFVEVVDEAGKIEKRKIQTGLEGDSGLVEILNGLQAGERVIISEKKD